MNFEKPTKSFCVLAKSTKGNDSLSQLKKKTDAQGNMIDYERDKVRNLEINKYFKGIYSKIPNKSLTLEQFLSVEILKSDYVQSKKLSNMDLSVVNVPISHHELSKALDEKKLGQARGWMVLLML